MQSHKRKRPWITPPATSLQTKPGHNFPFYVWLRRVQGSSSGSGLLVWETGERRLTPKTPKHLSFSIIFTIDSEIILMLGGFGGKPCRALCRVSNNPVILKGGFLINEHIYWPIHSQARFPTSDLSQYSPRLGLSTPWLFFQALLRSFFPFLSENLKCAYKCTLLIRSWKTVQCARSIWLWH